ncbi:hypothetical protein C0Q70_16987 [Pomacea canaliculata]|uniref:F5/8 type C domain-containing protein n=1 Tax=Pomacea canaliculata TaxID=400727 RepID=A0A2T7NRB4_POMCA|nr:intraflagellar transport protein 25 homolog [Pomacea canaliculata]PVD23714.1 hypothetical protein C0Q70_16987 [Pomacea canaliculata]
MLDYASVKEGAQIVLSTSSDENHPPENIIDGLDETFWATTGLYPQEVIIRFKSPINISSVAISCFNVQKIALEGSEQDNSDKFVLLSEQEFDRDDHHKQNEEIRVEGNKQVHCLRLLITSGYDHFVAVYNVKVNGRG